MSGIYFVDSRKAISCTVVMFFVTKPYYIDCTYQVTKDVKIDVPPLVANFTPR